jgi:hypothetical protein
VVPGSTASWDAGTPTKSPLTSELGGDRAPDAVPEHVGLLHVQVPEQADDIGLQVRGRQRPVDVTGTPVGLEVDGDHLPGVGEALNQWPELQVDVEESAVQQEPPS